MTSSRNAVLSCFCCSFACFVFLVRSQPGTGPAPVSAISIAARQVDGDGYGGTGYTVLPLVEEEPCTAIILHGLGGTGEEWGFVSLGLSYFSLNYVKFIIPTAANDTVTYLNNEVMPSWFDIRVNSGTDSTVNRRELLSSVSRINRIINGEIQNGVLPERIFVIGFSQGGALALTTFLRSSLSLGGCVGVATWLPLNREYTEETEIAVRDRDILMIHGTNDSAVLIEYGELSARKIRSVGVTVNFTRIPGAEHVILTADVIRMIEEYIAQRASGTTEFLKTLVSDLTNTFGSLNSRLSGPIVK